MPNSLNIPSNNPNALAYHSMQIPRFLNYHLFLILLILSLNASIIIECVK